jgi:Arc-like DNA binding domain
MPKKSKGDPVVQTGLRMRASLRDQLAKAAEARGVSLNYEMVDRLMDSFGHTDMFEVMRESMHYVLQQVESERKKGSK